MSLAIVRILTYKRTHIGDPDPRGRFGINECMGRIRDYRFDAVIGVGGIGSEPKSYGIDGKINWVGINATKNSAPHKRAAEVTFDHFVYLEEDGPTLESLAPNLAKRLYKQGARFLLDGYSDVEMNEAKRILEWSKFKQSSKVAGVSKRQSARPCGSAHVPQPPTRKCGCNVAQQVAAPDSNSAALHCRR